MFSAILFIFIHIRNYLFKLEGLEVEKSEDLGLRTEDLEVKS